MNLSPVAIYRWLVFLLAAGYCIRTLIFGGFDSFGGPFRFLTIWALFMSFFTASRMLLLSAGRSDRRWDGFVGMTAVINTMVVILYWRLAWHLEIYLHLVGPALQVIDTIFIHRSYRRIGPALAWLVGVIVVYLTWAEVFVGPMNATPQGSVTSGLPYPFLNNLAFTDRLTFYAINLATGLILLFVFAGIAWVVRRYFPAPARP